MTSNRPKLAIVTDSPAGDRAMPVGENALEPIAAAELGAASQAVRAMRLRQRGESEPYLEVLRDIFGPANRDELLDDERWSVAILVRLCADALHAGIERDYVTLLIRLRRLPPPSSDVLHWPWPIRVYTLGRFSLVKDGQLWTTKGKCPHKPLELLLALIALGGREVHTSAVMRALWPDEHSADLRKLFDNTLHRLRHILGHADAILLRDAKMTLNPGHCWVDAWAFERIAGRLIRDDAVEPELGDAARRLYQGHFLSLEADEPWLLPYRDRLRSRFHRLVLTDGRRLEAAGRWDAAAEIYESAIEIDNLAEILYRRLMVCRQQCGEFAEVLCVYRRCRDLLSIVLGVKPSAATEAIRRQAKEN